MKNIMKKESSSIKKVEVKISQDSFSKTERILDYISKGVVYLSVFLIPLFFLPWASNNLAFNKQALLFILVLIGFVSFLAKILIIGKFKLSINKIYLPVIVWLLVYSLSTIFSLWRYGSFWGWSSVITQSLFTLILLVIFYFLVINLFKRKDIFSLIVTFIISGLLVVLIGVMQLFGKFALSFPFTKITAFNTVGSVNQLAFFSVAISPLLFFILIKSKKVLKIISFVAIGIAFLLILFINLDIVWWLVSAVFLLIIVLGAQKRNMFNTAWLFIPTVFLAVSLLFLFFNFSVPGTPSRFSEFSLNYQTGFDISYETVKEYPILGSGPGTFIYDFSKYKDASLNSGIGWNLKFNNAGSRILTVLATTGIIGLISFIFLLASFAFLSIRTLIREKNKLEKDSWWLKAALAVSILTLSASFFLYSSSFVMDFSFFFLAGSLFCLTRRDRKEFILKPSSISSLVVTLAIVLIFTASLGLLVLEGQRYSAEVKYYNGLKAWSKGDIDRALNETRKAALANTNFDVYWRDLSQLYLLKAENEIAAGSLSDPQVAKWIREFIGNAVNSSKKATDINSKDVINWSVRGLVYQRLIGVVEGSSNWALESFERAIELEPANPYFPTQQGIIWISKALLLAEEEEKDEFFAKAITKLKKAIDLKSDYAPARYQLARVYQIQGKLNEAIVELEEAKANNPMDTGLSFQLGLAYYQNEEYTKARRELERTISNNPNYSNALYFLGLIYDRQNEKESAVDIFQRLADLNPENEEIKSILENLKAGRGALEDVSRESSEVPIEENSPEE